MATGEWMVDRHRELLTGKMEQSKKTCAACGRWRWLSTFALHTSNLTSPSTCSVTPAIGIKSHPNLGGHRISVTEANTLPLIRQHNVTHVVQKAHALPLGWCVRVWGDVGVGHETDVGRLIGAFA